MTTRETYHHGDLRTALVAEGLRQLEASGLELSLRAVAKAAGVSPNAPYRHFADKGALMAALAAEGFLRFADAITSAQGDDPIDGLVQQGRAFLRFARAHPALYRLMFSPLGYSLHSESCQSQAERAFGALIAMGARAQQAGWKPGQSLQGAVLSYWSALHGWVGLVNDALIPPDVPALDDDAWLQAVFSPAGPVRSP